MNVRKLSTNFSNICVALAAFMESKKEQMLSQERAFKEYNDELAGIEPEFGEGYDLDEEDVKALADAEAADSVFRKVTNK